MLSCHNCHKNFSYFRLSICRKCKNVWCLDCVKINTQNEQSLLNKNDDIFQNLYEMVNIIENCDSCFWYAVFKQDILLMCLNAIKYNQGPFATLPLDVVRVVNSFL